MRRIRLFQNTPFEVGAVIDLSSDVARHLVQVLRKKQGDQFWLFNGQGGEYQAEIESIQKKKVRVLLLRYQGTYIESPVSIHLGQCLSRGERMDYAIQKAVELGVSEITPLMSEYVQVKVTKERLLKRLQHWQAIVISACEQSGRCDIPKINSPTKLSDFILGNADKKYICCPRHNQTEDRKLSHVPVKQILLTIGPEGGFSDQEVSDALEKGFKTLPLGPRVLRTETATVSALTVLQLHYGDFSVHSVA